jgi:hypothetical protein
LYDVFRFNLEAAVYPRERGYTSGCLALPALRRRELTGLFGTLGADELEAARAYSAIHDLA